MAERSDGSLVCRMHRDGRDQVVRLRADATAGTGTAECSLVDGGHRPAVRGHRRSGHRHRPVAGPRSRRPRRTALRAGLHPYRGPGGRRDPLVRRGPGPHGLGGSGGRSGGPEAGVAEARPFTASTPDGPVPGLFYAPVGRAPRCPDRPTAPGASSATVAPPRRRRAASTRSSSSSPAGAWPWPRSNYRGSSGFGRAYRRRLRRPVGRGRRRRLCALRLGPGARPVWSTDVGWPSGAPAPAA